MIIIITPTNASGRRIWEVRFPYSPEVVSEFKGLTRGAASWDRLGRCWELVTETMAARVQAWADERNAPEVAEREAAEVVRRAAEQADRDAADALIEAAAVRHAGRVTRVGRSLTLCLAPTGLRYRADVLRVLARHGLPEHHDSAAGSIILPRRDGRDGRETDFAYATRTVAAVEAVLTHLYGDEDAVAGAVL